MPDADFTDHPDNFVDDITKEFWDDEKGVEDFGKEIIDDAEKIPGFFEDLPNEISKLPEETKDYFDHFTQRNIKIWNRLMTVRIVLNTVLIGLPVLYNVITAMAWNLSANVFWNKWWAGGNIYLLWNTWYLFD